MSMVGHAIIYQERTGYWCLLPPAGSIWNCSWYETQGQACGQARCMGWQIAGEEDIPLAEEQPATAEEAVA